MEPRTVTFDPIVFTISSAIVIGVLAIGAVAGWFTLPIAVLGHEISKFIVIGADC